MISPKPYISFKHIQSNTPEELELLMLSLSVKAPTPINFSTPSFSEKKWHTWYLHDWSLDIKAKEKFDLENK